MKDDVQRSYRGPHHSTPLVPSWIEPMTPQTHEWHKRQCECESCGYKWIGMVNEDTIFLWLECPSCKIMQGAAGALIENEAT